MNQLLRFSGPIALILIILISIEVNGQVTTWTGGANTTDWHTPGNWTMGVPDDTKNAIINSGTVSINTSAVAKVVTINGGTLQISNQLTIDVNNAAISGLSVIGANSMVIITASGDLIVQNSNFFAITYSNGTIENSGRLTIKNSNSGIYDGDESNGSINNYAKIFLEVTNSGVNVDDASIVNEFCGLIMSKNRLFAGGIENKGTIVYDSPSFGSDIGTNSSTGIIQKLGTGTISATINNGILDNNPNANYWRGCSSQVWSDGCNWSRDQEPVKADSVVVLSGAGAHPELSEMSDTIMHIYVSDTLEIHDGGTLMIDGSPATNNLVGARIEGYLHIYDNGSLETQSTSSHGIRSGSQILNEGSIRITDAAFSAIKLQTGTPLFTNNGSILVDNSGNRGIEVLEGMFVNNGIVDILGATAGIYMDNNGPPGMIENHGSMSMTKCSFSAIELKDLSGAEAPEFHNEMCAVITTDERLFLKPTTTFVNSGLINYTAIQIVNEGTYTDDGFQYDPNTLLPDGGSTKVLSAPRNLVYFNADLDRDGITLCMGDIDDAETSLACGTTLTEETNGGSEGDLNDYPCSPSNFSGPERIYTFEVVAPDTIISVSLSNESNNTQLFLLSDPTDPNSCLAHGSSSLASSLSPGTYYLAVDGFRGDIGTFDITLACRTPQMTPIPITCGQTLESQDNWGNVLLNDYPCRSFNFDGPERIYTFEVVAPNTLISVSLSNESKDTDLFLLSDPTDPNSCLAHGLSSLRSSLSPGTYYLAVDGYRGAVGTFDIMLNCPPLIPGNLCANAIPVLCGQSINGSLATAVVDSENNNGCDLDKEGLWYQFLGSGDTVIVSLCNTAESFDSELAVLTGSCGTLSCTDTQNDDSCGRLSEVTIATVQGDKYWIHVTEFSGGIGDFTLTISCQDDAGCIQQRLESGTLDKSTYTASQQILSDGLIASPNTVLLSAPEVELLKSFEVSDGVLTVDQEGCPE